MLDHLAIQCASLDETRAFYDAVLPALGGAALRSYGPVVGYGVGMKPDFWLNPLTEGSEQRPIHVAFAAPDRAAVRAFFAAAVAHDADVLHEPRVWPEYHPNYYGAFVRDPEGNNVEAVCHLPE